MPPNSSPFIRVALELLALRGSPRKRRRWHAINRRALFARFLLRDPRGRPWRARPYQVKSLESWASRKVHCDGRDVGKTSEIEIIAAYAMVTRPHSEMLIATQCENHLFPLMDRLARQIVAVPALAASLVEVKRTPSWRLRFSNGFILWGRIAGPRGVNFQGMHVDWQIVDEAQEMTDASWGELFQALNGGGTRWVYGVPNGLRNGFYRMTQDSDYEQHNWSSQLNPSYSPEKDAELARLYGGHDSPGYIHRVLGQHGEPEHAVFRLDDYLACVDESLDFHDIQLRADDDFEPPVGVERGDYYLGCDLGYARDPSEFVVYRALEPHFINVLRIHLEGVHYARQQSIIETLDIIYSFRLIGIDAGNNGTAVAHNLLKMHPDACERIHLINFGEVRVVDILPDGAEDRRRMKPFMTELIERRMAERSLVFPRLPERESQYASHTYRIASNGMVIYQKGNDHIIDADRCAVYARYLDTRLDPTPYLPPRIEGF